MFATIRYVYVEKRERIKFEVFARKVDFANALIERVNNICGFELKPKRFGFAKKVLVEVPPYELEQMQEDYVDRMEERKKNEQKN